MKRNSNKCFTEGEMGNNGTYKGDSRTIKKKRKKPKKYF